MRKLLIPLTMLLVLLAFSGQAIAGIHIDVNIPAPPVFAFPGPPELVIIPETNVYYCPDVDFDVYFYGGYWYRPYRGYWYRSASYGGPWAYIRSVPSVLLNVPPDYRIITRGERHIPYGELHRNWRAWERERYWEHHNWGRPEHEHYGLAPSYREREHGGNGRRAHERGEFHGEGGPHGGGGHEGHERH